MDSDALYDALVAGELAGGIQKMLNAATGALLYEFRVTGSLDKHQVIAVPTPVLTDVVSIVISALPVFAWPVFALPAFAGRGGG